MVRNVEYYTTLTIALIAINLTIHQAQGQSRTCSLLSRPHPNGFCGDRLAQAHSNVCFLLRRTYPHLFPMTKRSVPSESEVRPSVDSLLDSELDDDELTRYPGHRSDLTPALTRNNQLVSLLKPADGELGYTSDRTSPSAFINLLEKRNTRRKRSLVCECCYGPCTIRIIARYC